MEHVKSHCAGKHSKSDALLFAFALMIVGLALLIRNLGLVDEEVEMLIFSWPALIAVAGILFLKRKSWLFGIMLIFFGGFFIWADAYDFAITFEDTFWPALIIFSGLVLLYTAFFIFRKRNVEISGSNDQFIEEVCIFGGGEKTCTSDQFAGGRLVNIFGGSKIDLRNAQLADGHHELNFVTVFGGNSVLLPDNWNVKTEVVCILGNFADKRTPLDCDHSKTLTIRGVAILGGGEIKSRE